MAVLVRWLCGPLVLSLVLLALFSVDVTSAPASEAQVRAALLYNFASFTEWPDLVPDDRPIVIGVLGNDSVGKALQPLSSLATGRRIEVRLLTEADGLSQCQVLYIGALADRSVAATLARVTAMPVLTVGEQEHFTKLGGIIRLYSEDNRLRFAVDVAHAVSVRLKISSRVLNLARPL